MKKLLSCEFNMDTGCVELRYSDGSLYSIDCTAVENEVARNMYERSELDDLVYNDPVGYADLVFNGDLESYLRTVTDYKPMDNRVHDEGTATAVPFCIFQVSVAAAVIPGFAVFEATSSLPVSKTQQHSNPRKATSKK